MKIRFGAFLAVLLACCSADVYAQAREAVFDLAKKEKPALLETLKALVSIESGSSDFDGLMKLAAVISERLKALGGQVELVEPRDIYKMEDTPEEDWRNGAGNLHRQGSQKDPPARAHGHGLSARHACSAAFSH